MSGGSLFHTSLVRIWTRVRKRDREIDRQTDRQTETHRERKRDRETVIIVTLISHCHPLCAEVPWGEPSRGGNVAVYVFNINQSSLPTPFYSVLVSISVFMALSTVFHSINSPNNFLLSNSVFPVLFLPYWSIQLCIFYESLLEPW